MRPARALTYLLAVGIIPALASSAQQKKAITPSDCVTVRDLQHDNSTWRSTIKVSPDGTRIAYPVTLPSLSRNENQIELYVRSVAADANSSEKPIQLGDISSVRWLADGKHLTFLMNEDGRRAVEQLDVETGERQVLIKTDADITEYSTDRNGETIVYATKVTSGALQRPSEAEISRGYRIPYQTAADMFWARERLFMSRRFQGAWHQPEPIRITSPLSKEPLTELVYGAAYPNLNPELSPDGKKLLVAYLDFSEKMPDEWRTSGFMSLRSSAGVIQAFHVLVLFDLATKETTIALKTPWAFSAPLWSSDGKSFVVAARAPVGSELEQQDVKSHRIEHAAGAHLFWVEPGTANFEEITSKLANPWEGALSWDSKGDLLVRVAAMDTISRYSRKDGSWRDVGEWKLPIQVGSQVMTDGNYVIGDFNDTTTPPRLFVYRSGEKQVQVFAKLNPQFDDLTLARPEEVHWKTSTGFNASGLLLLPPNYVKGNRYPLVIQTKPFSTSFVCSFGAFPSFAPQPIANAGMMYLGQIFPPNATQRVEDYFPKGYPGYQGAGGVAEAAFAMDLWDSAVNALAEQGLIDRNRVGIIGFSRTGWYTEFILAHSQIRYRAATVADNVQYSMGEYWLSHDADTIKSFDQTYGGPPYGNTLKNWLNNSISFNLDKVHAPLLMEEMGNGRFYDNAAAPPLNVAAAFEVFTGLNRLNKPVEFYYYPNEGHTPDHPQARLATMQRNVDWYRFWLKNEEDPDPAKAEQYRRWRGLRKLDEADRGTSSQRPN